MPGRDERRALNEAFFRDFNERMVEQVKDTDGEQAPFNIACECSSPRCAAQIVVTPAEYDLLHADPRQFIVALGHIDRDIEDSVSETIASRWCASAVTLASSRRRLRPTSVVT